MGSVADALSLISADGSHTITVGTSEDDDGGRIVVSGDHVLPAVLGSGQFCLNMDLETTEHVGRALLRVAEVQRARRN